MSNYKEMTNSEFQQEFFNFRQEFFDFRNEVSVKFKKIDKDHADTMKRFENQELTLAGLKTDVAEIKTILEKISSRLAT